MRASTCRVRDDGLYDVAFLIHRGYDAIRRIVVAPCANVKRAAFVTIHSGQYGYKEEGLPGAPLLDTFYPLAPSVYAMCFLVLTVVCPDEATVAHTTADFAYVPWTHRELVAALPVALDELPVPTHVTLRLNSRHFNMREHPFFSSGFPAALGPDSDVTISGNAVELGQSVGGTLYRDAVQRASIAFAYVFFEVKVEEAQLPFALHVQVVPEWVAYCAACCKTLGDDETYLAHLAGAAHRGTLAMILRTAANWVVLPTVLEFLIVSFT